MKTERLLSILQGIMAQPTAPFYEDAVRTEILLQLAQCPHVKTTIDSFGNVIAQYRTGQAVPELLFSAHMDHPGYVGEEFLGGVPDSYLATNAPRRSFGAFSMWDLPTFKFEDGLVHSRACDDLIGCSVMVAMFHELERLGVSGSVMAVFTCAEEVGLLGAVHLAKSGSLPAGIKIISLETSSERPPAKMGDGVIIRVGDRTSVFEATLTSALVEAASVAEIPFQRCLMSGGTCEATAYGLYGYPVGGMCVALGNYHNCAPDGFIRAEYVSFTDVECMLRLCVAATIECTSGAHESRLRKRLEQLLEESMCRIRAF
ncbi:MAG: M20/M25/M40 family metallo-hydrolase [Verrucomicrobiota bacterium]